MITLSLTREQFTRLRAIHAPGSPFDSFKMINGQPKDQVWAWVNNQVIVLLCPPPAAFRRPLAPA